LPAEGWGWEPACSSFTGDTILIGAIAGGLLGLWLGAGFVEWMKENWLSFWV